MPTDPAVEALADVLWRHEVSTGQADAALDHIAAQLHDDTPEGAALRERLGVESEQRYGVRRTRGDVGSYVECINRRQAKGIADLWGATFTVQHRLVSPWRDA